MNIIRHKGINKSIPDRSQGIRNFRGAELPFWAPASLPGATTVAFSEAQCLETGGNPLFPMQPWPVSTRWQE